jgi:hypothetical protein
VVSLADRAYQLILDQMLRGALLRIPGKLTSDSGEVDHPSERSDAGTLVF